MENDSITKYNQSAPQIQQQSGRRAVADYDPSQLEFYRGIPTNCSISTMVAAQTPTIAKIKNKVSLDDTRALLSIAVCEVCDFFNVGKNMNDAQIALTVDLIIERFWYFKLEEVKFCFRRAMMRERLFDRLDGNIIIGWLREYDNERTEEAMRISDQEAAQLHNQVKEAPDAVSYEKYLAGLRLRAKSDNKAAEILHDIEHLPPQKLTLVTSEQRKQDEHDFKLFKLKYQTEKTEKNYDTNRIRTEEA